VCRRGPSARPTRRAASSSHDASDPAPLSPRQLGALLAGAIRELAWGLPSVAVEVRHWRNLATRIPNEPLRIDALDRKRGQSDGAALFATLPRARNRGFLRFLVAYQILWDYLDSVSERDAAVGLANGRQLHLALIDALDPDRPIRDYYRHNPWRDDSGYLRALVTTCRDCCAQLPGYDRVRPLIIQEARRAQVLALNHEPDPSSRDAALQAWVVKELVQGHQATWFELTGAASAGLAIFALLALACEPTFTDSDITLTSRAYSPWASAVACMLDSYADYAEDRANGDHSYISHYPTSSDAVDQVCGLVRRSLLELNTLKDSEKHVLIVASMVAMYLSKDSARTHAMRHATSCIASAGGSLTRALLPILRLWRVVYALKST
jgi:tetraprenyl-beta-curcumene synthase